MTGAQYGQRGTLGAREMDLHINIEDQITKFPKYRRELLSRLDGKNFKAEVKSHEYKWSTRDNRNLQTTLATDYTADATSLNVVDPGVLNVDDVIEVGGAQYIVEAIAGGTAATVRHLTGSSASVGMTGSVVIVGMATPQGKDADNMVVSAFEDLYNYTTILEDVVDLTGTQHNSLIRGEENSGQLIARKQMELSEKWQRQLIAGQRYKDSGRKQTMSGGLKYLIGEYAPDNKIDFGGDIWSSETSVMDKLDDALDIIAQKAFDKPVLYVTPAFMRKFKYIQDDTTQTSLREKARGVGVVRTYLSHTFGEIDVVQLQGMDHVMADDAFLVDESMFGFKAMKGRGWFTTPLAKNGDSYRWQVLGEYTVKLDIPQAAVHLHNLGL